MKLNDWLYENDMPVKVAADKLNVSFKQVYVWIKGVVKPNRESMAKILKLTQGRVTWSDWG